MKKKYVLLAIVLTMLVSLTSVLANASVLSNALELAFLYGDNSYLPLKSVANTLGASLGWDTINRQSVITYQGQDLVLVPNKRKAFYKGNPMMLSSPVVVINGVTYVPSGTFKKCYNVPMTWDGARSEVKIKGNNGWITYKTSSRPPWYGSPPPWAPAWGKRGYHGPHSTKWMKHGKAKSMSDMKQSTMRQKNDGKKQSKRQ